MTLTLTEVHEHQESRVSLLTVISPQSLHELILKQGLNTLFTIQHLNATAGAGLTVGCCRIQFAGSAAALLSEGSDIFSPPIFFTECPIYPFVEMMAFINHASIAAWACV